MASIKRIDEIRPAENLPPAEGGGAMFGEDRLFSCFRDMIGEPSMDIVHSVVGAVYEYTGFSSLHDDATVICIKRVE